MDKTEPRFQCQKHILNSALAVAAVYTQFIVLLMATSGPAERAEWNDKETNTFVEYLWEHRAEGGDGGNFKDVTFRAAAEHIADMLTAGRIKTPKCCKTKWTSVSHWLVNCPTQTYVIHIAQGSLSHDHII